MEKLLPQWGQEVGVDDALELLGPGFTDRGVRAFAVRRLERADDEVSHILVEMVNDATRRSYFCTCCSWYKPSNLRHL